MTTEFHAAARGGRSSTPRWARCCRRVCLAPRRAWRRRRQGLAADARDDLPNVRTLGGPRRARSRCATDGVTWSASSCRRVGGSAMPTSAGWRSGVLASMPAWKLRSRSGLRRLERDSQPVGGSATPAAATRTPPSRPTGDVVFSVVGRRSTLQGAYFSRAPAFPDATRRYSVSESQAASTSHPGDEPRSTEPKVRAPRASCAQSYALAAAAGQLSASSARGTARKSRSTRPDRGASTQAWAHTWPGSHHPASLRVSAG
jgi:hypothetical protein